MMLIVLVFVLLFSPTFVFADENHWVVNFDAAAVWQARNDVRIPGDTGTRFSIVDSISAGPYANYRLESFYRLSEKGQLRFLIAPFRYSVSGVTDKNIIFVDESFSSGQDTVFTYQFNSYRVSYRYLYKDSSLWQLWLGATAKVRDAEIAVKQVGQKVKDSNFGLVPLFNLYSDYHINTDWHFVVDFDGLVGPQGRAFDLGLRLLYDIDQNWFLGGGYRTLEGGADNDEVYNFAWFNYAFITIGYHH